MNDDAPPADSPAPPKRGRGRPRNLTKPPRAASPFSLPEELRKLGKRETYRMCSQEEAAKWPQHVLEFKAFALNPPHGLGRLKHFENFVKAVYPPLRTNWNPWMARMVEALTREHDVHRQGDMIIRATAFTGCGASGKTWTSGVFAPVWWAVDPWNSIAVITSTSHKMVRKRLWPVIRNFLDGWVDPQSNAKLNFPGHIVDSQTLIKGLNPQGAPSGDEMHALFALAVAEGETTKAVAQLKGMHAPRMLLIVDDFRRHLKLAAGLP
jgi:hypothetical protein